MQIVPFARIRTVLAEVNRLQDALVRFFRPIEDCVLLDHRIIKNQLITAGSNWHIVYHGLGRRPVGCLIISQSAADNVVSFDSPAVGTYTSTEDHLYLFCASPASTFSVVLLVF